MALGQGADGIETDVVLSADGVPICLHDLWLETTTNVAERFAGRARADGHYYAIDFSAAEVRQLRAYGRGGQETHSSLPPMRIPTLDDLLRLRHHLMRTLERPIVLSIELKAPAFHRERGMPLEERVLEELKRHGCEGRDTGVSLHSFDAESLKRLRTMLQTPLPLYQITAEPVSPSRAEEFRAYAEGVSVSRWLIEDGEGKEAAGASLSTLCHQHGLKLFVWTMGRDEQAVHRMFWRYGVDGVITDNPDVAVKARTGTPIHFES